MTFCVRSPNFDVLSVIIISLLALKHYENILKRTIYMTCVSSGASSVPLGVISDVNSYIPTQSPEED